MPPKSSETGGRKKANGGAAASTPSRGGAQATANGSSPTSTGKTTARAANGHGSAQPNGKTFSLRQRFQDQLSQLDKMSDEMSVRLKRKVSSPKQGPKFSLLTRQNDGNFKVCSHSSRLTDHTLRLLLTVGRS